MEEIYENGNNKIISLVTSEPPYERPLGLYTVILVDSSESIKDPIKQQIAEFIADFIDGNLFVIRYY